MSRLSAERKMAIRLELERLGSNGYLRPELVVESARDPSSPMHDQFEWNDTEAAEQYRLAQARTLIRTVNVSVIRSDSREVRVPMFVSSTVAPDDVDDDAPADGRAYRLTQVVVADRPDHDAVIARTLMQCRTMVYNLASAELDAVITAIDDALDLVNTRRFKATPAVAAVAAVAAAATAK